MEKPISITDAKKGGTDKKTELKHKDKISEKDKVDLSKDKKEKSIPEKISSDFDAIPIKIIKSEKEPSIKKDIETLTDSKKDKNKDKKDISKEEKDKMDIDTPSASPIPPEEIKTEDFKIPIKIKDKTDDLKNPKSSHEEKIDDKSKDKSDKKDKMDLSDKEKDPKDKEKHKEKETKTEKDKEINIEKDKTNPTINSQKLERGITIIKQDITILNTDAIVNAANDGLWAGGGVCGAIFRAAGSFELQKACDKIGGCPEGKAVITPGFKLKAKYIIHAVGPVWCGGHRNEPNILYSAYISSLELALQNGCTSIAFPLISGGIFGYPTKEAWEVALTACYDFFMKYKNVPLLIIFAVIENDKLEIGKKVYQKMFSKK